MTTNDLQTSFIKSILAEENTFQPFSGFDSWLDQAVKKADVCVKPIAFEQMQKWSFNSLGNLSHTTGSFFSVDGIRVKKYTDAELIWDQPIINQPEIGLLGILSKNFNGVRYFLMQAKVEPGNIGLVQISPTVQATYSNMTKVHGGDGQYYLEYFYDSSRSQVLVDQVLSEQGSRFYQKRNRNVVIDVFEDIELREGFCWLTLAEIKLLLKRDNIVNMDARSVISCMPGFRFENRASEADCLSLLQQSIQESVALDHYSQAIVRSMQSDAVVYSSSEDIAAWFEALIKVFKMETTLIPLHSLQDWLIKDDEISHRERPFFSVIAVRVEASTREVSHWDQPLIKDEMKGLIGYISKEIDGVLHFLMQAKVEAGNRDMIEMAPTVSCSNYKHRWESEDDCPFLAYFVKPDASTIRYDSYQSEEGGRFFHYSNRNMILEVPDLDERNIPENFIWMSLYQLEEFQRKGYLNIDARTLLSSLTLVRD